MSLIEETIKCREDLAEERMKNKILVVVYARRTETVKAAHQTEDEVRKVLSTLTEEILDIMIRDIKKVTIGEGGEG